MYRGYLFRLYPNKHQTTQLLRTFGCVRFVYNYFLMLHITYYEATGEYLSKLDCMSNLPYLKSIFPFLKECDSIALQQALHHLDDAFHNFFERPGSGYPKYKKRYASRLTYSTICVNDNIRIIDKKHIQIPKLGTVRCRIHRNVPSGYKLKSATLIREPSGDYFVSVLFEYDNQVEKITPKSFLGLDFSMPHLYVDSDGRFADYPKFLRRSEDKLAKEQRKLSKMQFRSSNWYKQKRKVARLYQKVRNQRRDFLHKLSFRLAENYDLIAIEDLDMHAMSQALNFSKSVSDNGWGMFTAMLSYKMDERGKSLVKVDKWFPSTKTCHRCGSIKPMPIGEDTYICPECGMVFDRDHNAAINILNEGKRIYYS